MKTMVYRSVQKKIEAEVLFIFNRNRYALVHSIECGFEIVFWDPGENSFEPGRNINDVYDRDAVNRIQLNLIGALGFQMIESKNSKPEQV